jgi:GTP-binding protein
MRVIATPLDRQLLDWFAPTGRPVRAAHQGRQLSKQEDQQLRNVGEALAAKYHGSSVQLFSARTRQGVDEAEALLVKWFDAGLGRRGQLK